jgi:hypothetical protein
MTITVCALPERRVLSAMMVGSPIPVRLEASRSVQVRA